MSVTCISIERFSIDCGEYSFVCFGFAFVNLWAPWLVHKTRVTFSDQSGDTRFFQPIRSKAKTNRDLVFARFAALGTGYVFSRVCWRLRVFPCLALVSCFPALGASCMVLLRVLIGSLRYLHCCDWSDEITLDVDSRQSFWNRSGIQTSINFVFLAGLVETTLEHIKHLHAQLNMNSLQLGKGPSWKRKVDDLCDHRVSFPPKFLFMWMEIAYFFWFQFVSRCMCCATADLNNF